MGCKGGKQSELAEKCWKNPRGIFNGMYGQKSVLVEAILLDA